jgi:hypothetical protein
MQITCPANPDATLWPDCKLFGPSPNPTQLPLESLIWIPEFDVPASGEPEWRGCMGWAPHHLTDAEEVAMEQLLMSRFQVEAANVTSSPFQEGLALSLEAVRRMSCDPAAASGSFADAVNQAAADVIGDRETLLHSDVTTSTRHQPARRCVSSKDRSLPQ